MYTWNCLAVDASYKVPKLMLKWGDNTLYDALQTGMNEYSECILQHFCSSDIRRQLVPVLRHLHSLGLDPSFAFTDNPRRDTEFLEREFNGLTGDPDEVTHNWRINDSNTIPLRGGILYAKTYQEATNYCRIFIEALDTQAADDHVIYIDTEWAPGHCGSNTGGVVSVVQFVCNDLTNVIVLHLSAMRNPK
jgi:hypothetical protein